MTSARFEGPSIAVIGAGPGGLSAARLLKEQGLRRITVFEASDRVGGKSFSVPYRGAHLEMGTCYSTLDHVTTNRWMRAYGIRQYALGRQMMDGTPFTKFIRSGPGLSLPAEGVKYIRLWRRFQKDYASAAEDSAVRAEAAMPLAAWLDQHGLARMERFMLRGITAIGYGYIDQISTLQALNWATPSLLFSGLLNQLKMPHSGWQDFWERVAADLDVRRGEGVISVERGPAGIDVTTPLSSHRFDHLLVTIPLDDFAQIAKVTAEEADINASIEWGNYTATLCLVDNWFTKYETESFETALRPGAELGRVLSARRERMAKIGRGDSPVYLCAQYGPGMSQGELAAHLVRDIESKGAQVRGLLFQKPWKYHARLRGEAIADGVTLRMAAMQGKANTWYSGASFSHEAVSAVVAHNVKLARQMAERLKRAH